MAELLLSSVSKNLPSAIAPLVELALNQVLIRFKAEGSATVLNHVDDYRNHLESLLEPTNQVENLESKIRFLVHLVVFRIL